MEEKEKACLCLKILFERGLITLKSGNVSFLDKGGNAFWITPSGKTKILVMPEDLVKISLDGEILEGGRPSIEYKMHLYSYKNGNANAIVHAHPPYSLALAEVGLLDKIEEYYEGKLLVGKVGVVEKFPPGSEDLAINAAKCLKDSELVILRGHGCISRGKDLFEALERILALENLAKAIMAEELLKKLL